jgi:hypothetical protein
VVNPHRQSIGRGGLKKAVKDPVWGIEGRDVTLGQERESKPQAITPPGEMSLCQGPGQLLLEGAVHSIRIAAHGLVADEQATQNRPY